MKWTGATTLAAAERKIYSQNGEDGVIERLLELIGSQSKYAVEFGVQEGKECNTRFLREQGWTALMMDGRGSPENDVKQAFITAENINELFERFGVPHDLDLLSIDIDYNTFWVWKAIREVYRPRLVVVEYNATIAPCYAQTVPYNAERMWDRTNYFGASLLAYHRLGRKKGYDLVYCDSRGINAFFVRSDIRPRSLPSLTPAQAYRPPCYGRQESPGVWLGHRASPEAFVALDEELNVIGAAPVVMRAAG
jgi:hypothetical protein